MPDDDAGPLAQGADVEPFFAWADAFLGRGSEPLRVPASE